MLAHASCQEVLVSYLTIVKLYFLSKVDEGSKDDEAMRATCSYGSTAEELSFKKVATHAIIFIFHPQAQKIEPPFNKQHHSTAQ